MYWGVTKQGYRGNRTRVGDSEDGGAESGATRNAYGWGGQVGGTKSKRSRKVSKGMARRNLKARRQGHTAYCRKEREQNGVDRLFEELE